jgi:hypothetical protein
VPSEKDKILEFGDFIQLEQVKQLENPDSRIALDEGSSGKLLEIYSHSYKGITTGDDPHYVRFFWEIGEWDSGWRYFQSTVDCTLMFGGLERIVWLSKMGESMDEASQEVSETDSFLVNREISKISGVYIRARATWGKQGVAVSQMSNLLCALSLGAPFDTNTGVILPNEPDHLPAIWCFCSSPEFNIAVRRIDQALKVTNASLVKVPFDLAHWQKVAEEKYPDGLPKPFSSDPTQWLFNGHPYGSDDPLQVAVARLLGYRWPRQTMDPADTNEQTGMVPVGSDGLEAFADTDGIVCLPAVAGEDTAAERLRALLAAAFLPPPAPESATPSGNRSFLAAKGESTTPASSTPFAEPEGVGRSEERTEAGGRQNTSGVEDGEAATAWIATLTGGKSLAEWLANDFFAAHCKRFHNRPFIWHIWDGRKDGFSVLVNYHRLDRAKLEKLIYVTLGDWITAQKRDDDAGVAGAGARLAAAVELKAKLEAILTGEPPYDIYIRWKPLAQQPLGWDPDLNDGVRLNIRPFLTAEVLRSKSFKIKMGIDRGTNPDGTARDNDKHYTLTEKRVVRGTAT